MRTSKVISLSLPPQLYEQMRKLAAREGRTHSELFREALRQYMELSQWKALQRYGMGRARLAGIRESDVERLIDEYREEREQR